MKIILALQLVCATSLCQESTILKLQFKNLEYQPVYELLNFTIDNKPPTNRFDAGKYEAVVPADIDEVSISILNTEHRILFPSNGKVLIPKNASKTTDIIIGTNKDYTTLKNIWPLIKKMQLTNDSNQLYCKLAKDFIENVNMLKVDSLILQEKRDSVFRTITPLLNNYYNILKDVQIAFHALSINTFINGRGIRLLNVQVTDYNKIWKEFYEQKDISKKIIQNYWGGNSVVENTLLTTFNKIEDIHKTHILPLNDILISYNHVISSNDKESERNSKLTSLFNSFQNEIKETRFINDLALLEININQLNEQLK